MFPAGDSCEGISLFTWNCLNKCRMPKNNTNLGCQRISILRGRIIRSAVDSLEGLSRRLSAGVILVAVCVYIYIYVYTCIYIYIYTCAYVRISLSLSIYIYIYMCIYIYIYISAGRRARSGALPEPAALPYCRPARGCSSNNNNIAAASYTTTTTTSTTTTSNDDTWYYYTDSNSGTHSQ